MMLVRRTCRGRQCLRLASSSSWSSPSSNQSSNGVVVGRTCFLSIALPNYFSSSTTTTTCSSMMRVSLFNTTTTTSLRQHQPSSWFSTSIIEKNDDGRYQDQDRHQQAHDFDGNTKQQHHHQYRNDILQAAVVTHPQYIYEYGWTEDAIAATVLALRLPITMTGIVSSSDLIVYFMQHANEKFRNDLKTSLLPKWYGNTMNTTTTTSTPSSTTASDDPSTFPSSSTDPLTATGKSHPIAPFPQRVIQAIQARLTYTLPFVKRRTWHDGMALGAMPSNLLTTQALLQDMIQDITRAVVIHDTATTTTANTTTTTNTASVNPSPQQQLLLLQGAIGAIYVATELHLLTDHSPDFADSWNFLRQRVYEMDRIMANITTTQDVVLSGAATAATATLASIVFPPSLFTSSSLSSTNSTPSSSWNPSFGSSDHQSGGSSNRSHVSSQESFHIQDALTVASTVASSLAGAVISLTLPNNNHQSVRAVHETAISAASAVLEQSQALIQPLVAAAAAAIVTPNTSSNSNIIAASSALSYNTIHNTTTTTLPSGIREIDGTLPSDYNVTETRPTVSTP